MSEQAMPQGQETFLLFKERIAAVDIKNSELGTAIQKMPSTDINLFTPRSLRLLNRYVYDKIPTNLYYTLLYLTDRCANAFSERDATDTSKSQSHSLCSAFPDQTKPTSEQFLLLEQNVPNFERSFRLLYNLAVELSYDPEIQAWVQMKATSSSEIKTMEKLEEESSFDLCAACKVLDLSEKDAEVEYEKIVRAKTEQAGPSHDSISIQIEGDAIGPDVHETEQGHEENTSNKSLEQPFSDSDSPEITPAPGSHKF